LLCVRLLAVAVGGADDLGLCVPPGLCITSSERRVRHAFRLRGLRHVAQLPQRSLAFMRGKCCSGASVPFAGGLAPPLIPLTAASPLLLLAFAGDACRLWRSGLFPPCRGGNAGSLGGASGMLAIPAAVEGRSPTLRESLSSTAGMLARSDGSGTGAPFAAE